MRVWRWALAVVAASLAVGCTDNPDPPVSFVEGLRVLAVRAEPPEVAVGGMTQVTVLAVDTTGAAVDTTWTRCRLAPRSGEAVNPLCATAETAAFIEPLGAGLTIMTDMPAVTPKELGQPDSTNGVYLPIVARTTNGTDSVTAIYRLRLNQGSPPNANPVLATVEVVDAAGVSTPLDEATPLIVHEGDEVTLTSTFTPDSAQMYTAFGGMVVTETLTTAWFATAGEFSVSRTSDDQPQTVLRLTERLPSAGKTIEIWAVGHDERGGVGYTHRVLELK